MNLYDGFTNKYGVSKVLCFELIPQGKTLENMIANGVLDEDEHRAKSVQKVKNMINEYHRYFIDETLSNVKLYGLDEYYDYYKIQNRNDDEKQAFIKIQTDMRKQIADVFVKHPLFKKLFGKELFSEILRNYFKGEEEQSLLDEFKGFTTYFVKFNSNRKNFYTDEAVFNAIGYRLIHENLPLFIQNIYLFEKLEERINDIQTLLTNDLGHLISGNSVKDYFGLDGFNLVLTQKDISNYNLLISGYSKENGEKVKGLNEYINLYNQKAKKEERLRKLKLLKKQILSEKQSFSFVLDKFETDEEVITAIMDYWNVLKPILSNFNHSFAENPCSMMELLFHIRNYDLEKIYIRDDAVSVISQHMFGKWNSLLQAMYAWYDLNYTGSKKIGTKTYEQEKEKYFKTKESFSVGFLNACCKCLNETKEGHVERCFEKYCDSKYQNFSMILTELESEMRKELQNSKSFGMENKTLASRKNAVRVIKAFLDEIIEYQKFLKPLLIKGDGLEVDYEFYDAFMPMYESISEIVPLYNKVRNYLTKKPYSEEKIKLNFSNPSLLSGWSFSKETTNNSVIFRKEGLYYLGIINKSFRKIFEGDYPADGEVYEKMEYRLLPGANKMLPKVFLAAKDAINKYQPSEQVLKIYKNGTFKKGKEFSLDDCHILIDYFKHCIEMHEEWSKFEFRFSDTDAYEDISGFYHEVENQGYQMRFRNISKSYVEQLVKEGKLYLFQIYNKDFSPYSKGTANLHTLYFKALFAPENLKNVVYKLNGDAEIFYRKKSIAKENIITHPANEPVINKNPLNLKKTSLFTYTLYKDKRYTVDKFQFHVPITMNFKSTGTGRLNTDVNRVLKEEKETYVIGINRGERHLLYVTVVNSNGTIVEEYSLNEIVNEYKGVTYPINYHNLLESKADERDLSRKNWDTIENIKELKEGYISNVIHKITQLMIKYQAVVVIEDLNFGFLRGRQHIEKNVYQKFVKMLIDKLNYYVDKKIDAEQNGGLYHAYQLTSKFESFKKLGKQNGFLFFAPAYYISNIDPTTGFVNLLYPKYESIKASKEFFSKFDDIFYDAEHDYFCFDTDYRKFTDKATGTGEKWIICSHGSRVHSFRNPEKYMQWDIEVVYPTKLLKDLFCKYNVKFEHVSNRNLKEQILSQNEREFFAKLMDVLELILQMRNYDKEIDYIISPVLNKSGTFFDSRDKIKGLPTNIEANGAYNIARKGLWMINKIKGTDAEKLGKESLAMTNEEWLQFAQKI